MRKNDQIRVNLRQKMTRRYKNKNKNDRKDCRKHYHYAKQKLAE